MQYLPEFQLQAGGVVRAVIDTVERLSKSGVTVTLLTYDPSDCPESWQDPENLSVQIVVVPRPKLGGFLVPGELKRAIKAVVAEQDVIHLHTPWAVFNGHIAGVARDLAKPYLVTLHGMLDDWCMTQRGLKKKIFLQLFGRKMLEGAAYVHCTASGEVEQSHKWYPAGKACVMPCIVDFSPYSPTPLPDMARKAFKYLNQAGSAKLLFLSRIHVKKGLERLIRASGELKRRGVSFELGIAGPGDDDYVLEMKSLVRAEGVEEHCHFLGMVDGKLKYSLYTASDVFVLPTSQENFGLVFAESMLCGTPVVATRGVDIWKELQEAGAVIVDPTPIELADAITGLVVSGRDELSLVGMHSREYVKKWLDPDNVIEQYLSAYRGDL